MPLPQDIRPFNSELMDTLVEAGKMDWIPSADDPKRAFMKILWTGSESGTWAESRVTSVPPGAGSSRTSNRVERANRGAGRPSSRSASCSHASRRGGS